MQEGNRWPGCRESGNLQSLNGVLLPRRSRATAWEPESASLSRTTGTMSKTKFGVNPSSGSTARGCRPATASAKESAEEPARKITLRRLRVWGPGNFLLMPSFRSVPARASQSFLFHFVPTSSTLISLQEPGLAMSCSTIVLTLVGIFDRFERGAPDLCKLCCVIAAQSR